jgi:hypothetical protein
MSRKPKKTLPPDHWELEVKTSEFGEMFRRARSRGPQHVKVNGEGEVVVMAAEEFHRLKGERTGSALIEALQASPFPDIEIEPERQPMPVRDMGL